MPLEHLIIIFLVSAFASVYGVMFGGTGFLIMPMLFMLGVDPKVAIASSIVSGMGSILSSGFVFYRGKKINSSILKWTALFFTVGSIAGLFILIKIDAELIKKMVSAAIVLLAILSIFEFEKMMHGAKEVKLWQKVVGAIAMVILGVYLTVITAGTSTIMIFIFVYIFGLSIKEAMVIKPSISFFPLIITSVLLYKNGFINFEVALPMIAGRAIGAFFGAKITIKSNNKFLSVAFSVAVVFLALKTLLF